MKKSAEGNLRLGSNVVELLLPQRRPFLMVDACRSFHYGPVPALQAYRHISANEGCFEGHFPGLHIWPGAFTIEGLGQSSVLLSALIHVHRTAEAEGIDPELVLDELRELDRAFRLQPGFRAGRLAAFWNKLREARARIAVGTSVDMKFVQPVFAGQRLDYSVRLTGEHGNGVRFETEASVEGVVVAKGILMGAMMVRPASPWAEDGP